MRLLVEQLDDTTSDFWIKNFQFELFYNLTNHYERGSNQQKVELEGAPINTLPTEMLSRIFSFLTAVDLLVVRDVCSHWGSIVDGDKALWNHTIFIATDFDVKTTASLVKEMPLLRKINCCNVNSPEDMNLLIAELCDACLELHHIQFPESCSWHPSAHDLHQLTYYHPRVESLQLCTKQKLTGADLSNFGIVLSEFHFLKHLKLVGFYWHQAELIPELLSQIEPISSLSLPSLPGISGGDLVQLSLAQPELTSLTLNTSSIPGAQLSNLKTLNRLTIIDSSNLTTEKLKALSEIIFLVGIDINLSNSSKENVLNMFKHRPFLKNIKISNCEYSDELLQQISKNCVNLETLMWSNPKDVAGEITDVGILAITHFSFLQSLDIKSRSVTKAYYPNLAAMKSLKYARINGMRVSGCL